ncbi:MAG: 16S rRNA (guanine(966)-N(2))-methyltransferase RsmD [Chlamydiia bacterium]
MRISGGELRGRMLRGPKGDQTRPTSTLVRAAIFNILGNDLSGGRVLDLFAGGGGLGIEALSRGASHAVFVESHRLALDALRNNLRDCGLEERATVLSVPVSKAWNRLEQEAPFDWVFADPPYELIIEGQPAALWTALHVLRAPWIRPSTRIIIESHQPPDPLIVEQMALPIQQVRRYGSTHLWLLKGALEES